MLFSWKKILEMKQFFAQVFITSSFFHFFFNCFWITYLSIITNFKTIPPGLDPPLHHFGLYWRKIYFSNLFFKRPWITNCLPDFHTFLWPWFLGHSKCIFQVGHKIELSNFVIGWGPWLDTRFNASLHSLEHVYFGNWSNYQSSVSTMSCLVRFKRD